MGCITFEGRQLCVTWVEDVEVVHWVGVAGLVATKRVPKRQA
jgi:hypothetical protein